MFRGARRALHFAGVNLIAFLRSIPGYFASWPMQELTGTTALADNVAVALGRDLVINGDFANWTGVAPADSPDDWTTTQVGDATSNVTQNPAGECQIISDGTFVGIEQDILSPGKSYTATCTVTDATLGVLLWGDNGGPQQGITSIGAKTFSFTAVTSTFIFKRQAAAMNITIDNVVVKQTGILDSSAGLGLLDGTYVGVTLAQPGAGNVPYMVSFDGATSYLDIYSAEHNSAVNPLSFEIVIFGNDFTWDASVRSLLHYFVDVNNYIRIEKTGVAGQLAVYYQEQGQALVTQLIATGSPSGLFSVGISVQSNVFQATYNGAQVGANQATTSAFVGNFTIMTIGARNTTPALVTLGSLAYPVEFTAQLSAATRLQIKSAFGVS